MEFQKWRGKQCRPIVVPKKDVAVVRYKKIFGGLFFRSVGCHAVEIGSNYGDRIRVC